MKVRNRLSCVALTAALMTVAVCAGSTPAGATTADLGPFNTPSALVTQQFQDFLNRAPSGPELSTWSDQVAGGTEAGTVIQGISNLAGGGGPFGSVDRLYAAYFLRIPDYGGLRHWLTKSRGGTSLRSISNSFAHSSEFLNRYGLLSNVDFVTLVYKKVLGRAPDSGGLKHWVGKLASGTSRGSVMVGFSESSEYKRKTANATAAQWAYFAMLHRSPTTNENASAMAIVNSLGFNDLAEQILGGIEYATRLGVTGWLVPVTGAPLGQIVVDATGTYAYATNRSANEVEVLDIASHSLMAPIPVGSMPYGIDFSPDGKTLYVANSGGSTISVVDVATHDETKKITISPSMNFSDRPMMIAVDNKGVALIATTFDGSGFGGRLLSLNTSTGVVTAAPCCLNNSVTEYTPMQASGDRSHIFLALGDDSGGRVVDYTASTGTFSSPTDLNGFIDSVSVDGDGDTVAWSLYQGTVVTDAGLVRQGTISGGGHGQMVLDSAGTTGYRVENSPTDYGADALLRYVDVSRFTTGSTVGLPDSMPAYGASSLKLVPGSQLVLVLSTQGIVISRLPTS
ncbi:MAG: hypothetical protein JWM89_4107 [Acidimicrobiales bacterium]|nr:hypothetical protein [Acidimicrobiales bacterium]